MIRVLIADDELYFRNYMLTAVDWHSLGFQVCCLAQNGEEVLFELSKNTINIVFLDINMPHINGLTLAEKIKEEHPHIMIVFITGYSDLHALINSIVCFDYTSQHRKRQCVELSEIQAAFLYILHRSA